MPEDKVTELISTTVKYVLGDVQKSDQLSAILSEILASIIVTAVTVTVYRTLKYCKEHPEIVKEFTDEQES